jgi:hypothetical protein
LPEGQPHIPGHGKLTYAQAAKDRRRRIGRLTRAKPPRQPTDSSFEENPVPPEGEHKRSSISFGLLGENPGAMGGVAEN